ncbi:MAG: hypothetical protein ACE5OP_08625 [Candidatus Glassbacteria bacterium]
MSSTPPFFPELEGFPVLIEDGQAGKSSVNVGDIDGDGDLEIVHGALERPCFVFAWHHDGTPVDGWPKDELERFSECAPA